MKNIEEITAKLEQGVKDVFTGGKYAEYLSVMGKFYRYSANNCMLISMQCPNATLIAGFNQWKNDFKRSVKKGEKAIKILAPMPHKFVKEVVNDDGETEEREVNFMTFRAVPVFDLSQTDGEDLPSLIHKLYGSVQDFESVKRKLECIAPVPVSFEDITGSANGYFSPSEKRIAVKAGMSEEQTIKTLVHEISHSILHGEDGEEKDKDRRTMEVQAESIAYVVCNWIGVDTSDYSFGYVAGWSTGRELKELSESLEVIRKTSKKLIEGLQSAA
ncbi:MAG: ImmA/IrrE family metallo-endopeptidase [Blautia sp.]|nr:ImmA/IrrE family metallo-endopeptidase [Blautia sp.]